MIDHAEENVQWNKKIEFTNKDLNNNILDCWIWDQLYSCMLCMVSYYSSLCFLGFSYVLLLLVNKYIVSD